MVQAIRAMTPMGMAIAAGKEINLIHYGNQPSHPPTSRPPVSFRGSWGGLQQEARKGAIVGNAKTTSSEFERIDIAKRLSSHCCKQF